MVLRLRNGGVGEGSIGFVIVGGGGGWRKGREGERMSRRSLGLLRPWVGL